MALGSTQPETEISTRSISWGIKSGRCVRRKSYHHPGPLSRNLGTLTSWNPLGTLGPVMGLIYLFTTTTTTAAAAAVTATVQMVRNVASGRAADPRLSYSFSC